MVRRIFTLAACTGMIVAAQAQAQTAAPAAAPPPAQAAPPQAASAPGPLVAFTSRKPAPFGRAHGPEVLFAVVGVAAMYAEGSATLHKYGLEDPTAAMARDIAAKLAAARSGRLADAPIPVDHDDVETLSAAAVGSRYIVDVRMMGWGVAGSDSVARMRYRLIDVEGRRVVAASECRWAHKKADDNPDTAKLEVFGDQGLGLKAQLAEAQAFCESKFWAATEKL